MTGNELRQARGLSRRAVASLTRGRRKTRSIGASSTAAGSTGGTGQVRRRMIRQISLVGIIIVTWLINVDSASSAEFELVVRPNGNAFILVSGEIQAGDSVQFNEVVREAIFQPGISRLVVSLDSPGGDIFEAMLIGETVRSLLAETWVTTTTVYPPSVNGEAFPSFPMEQIVFAPIEARLPRLSRCWGACTLIWASGATRYAFDNRDSRTNELGETVLLPSVGVHRPRAQFISREDVSAEAAEVAYAKMLDDYATFLRRMGVSEEFIRLSLSTDASNVQLLHEDELSILVERKAPFFADWVHVRCGSETDTLTEREFRAYQQYRAFSEEYYQRYFEADWDVARAIPSLELSLAETFGLEDAAEMRRIAERVDEYSRWIDFCRDVVVRSERRDWANESQ